MKKQKNPNIDYSEYRAGRDNPNVHDLLYDELHEIDKLDVEERFNQGFYHHPPHMRDYIYVCNSTGGVISRRVFDRSLGIKA
jgi:hypothetical protein